MLSQKQGRTQEYRRFELHVCATALSVRVKAAVKGNAANTSYQPHKHANVPLGCSAPTQDPYLANR